MNIQEITVKEEQWPIKFGFDALSKFQDMTGVSIEQVGNLGGNLKNFAQVIDLLYCGFWYGHKRTKKPFTMTRDEFEEICSDHPEIVGAASYIFNQSQPGKEEKKSEVMDQQSQ